MTNAVLLLHGLWMRAPAMRPLAWRLRAAGFAPATFDYASRAAEPSEICTRLAERIADGGGAPVHLVGHSLGGLIALRTLALCPGLAVGRVVCLGSPLRGAQAAAGLSRHAIAPWFLGRSASLLCEGATLARSDVPVGVIAGTRGFGLGRLFARFEGIHDGTVAVSETRIDGLTDHAVVSASHSGLLFSPTVAALTAAFLRDGVFPAAAMGVG